MLSLSAHATRPGEPPACTSPGQVHRRFFAPARSTGGGRICQPPWHRRTPPRTVSSASVARAFFSCSRAVARAPGPSARRPTRRRRHPRRRRTSTRASESRHDRPPVLLVQAVLGGGEQQLGAAAERLDEERRPAGLERAVGVRDRRGQDAAGGLGRTGASAARSRSARSTGRPARPIARKPGRVLPGQRRAAEHRGRGVVGMALDARRQVDARRRRRAPRARR